MRVRSSHIIVTVLVLMGAFFFVAWLRMNAATGVSGETDDFLAEARAIRESGKGSPVRDGLLRGTDSVASSPPKVEVETEDFDMGVIDNKKPTTKEMAVYNRGESPLKILDVKTSCGCTQGELPLNSKGEDGRSITVIPAGGELPMSITVDPFRIPGFSSKKVLTLFSNDPLTPAVKVAVSADVKPEFTLEPETLDLGTVENGREMVAKVIVREANEKNFEIRGVEPGRRGRGVTDAGNPGSEASPYSLELTERPKTEWQSPEHPEWIIEVRLSPNLPIGSFRDSFRILTNSKRLRNFAYRLSVDVESFFTVSPTMLSVRNAVDPGSKHVATAVVSSDQEFSLDNLDVSGDAFTVVLRDGDKPNTKFIDLGIRTDVEPGLKNERISFTIRSGEKTAKHTMRAFASIKG